MASLLDPVAFLPLLLAGSLALVPTSEVRPAMSGPCPTARGKGTVSPSIAIREMTWIVNGREQKVTGDTTLQARVGDELILTEVVLCTAFEDGGGRVCVDVSPVDREGQAILAEHQGTHLVTVVPGEILIPGLEFSWTVGDDWAGLAAVVNHWTPEKTRDLECAGGLCERDDRVLVELR